MAGVDKNTSIMGYLPTGQFAAFPSQAVYQNYLTSKLSQQTSQKQVVYQSDSDDEKHSMAPLDKSSFTDSLSSLISQNPTQKIIKNDSDDSPLTAKDYVMLTSKLRRQKPALFRLIATVMMSAGVFMGITATGGIMGLVTCTLTILFLITKVLGAEISVIMQKNDLSTGRKIQDTLLTIVGWMTGFYSVREVARFFGRGLIELKNILFCCCAEPTQLSAKNFFTLDSVNTKEAKDFDCTGQKFSQKSAIFDGLVNNLTGKIAALLKGEGGTSGKVLGWTLVILAMSVMFGGVAFVTVQYGVGFAIAALIVLGLLEILFVVIPKIQTHLNNSDASTDKAANKIVADIVAWAVSIVWTAVAIVLISSGGYGVTLALAITAGVGLGVYFFMMGFIRLMGSAAAKLMGGEQESDKNKYVKFDDDDE